MPCWLSPRQPDPKLTPFSKRWEIIYQARAENPHQVVGGETQTHGAEGAVREIEEVETLCRKVLIKTQNKYIISVALI